MTNRAERQADPAYELINPLEHSSILYRQHGFPHPLVRWHYHREYELHLITASSGKVFVGDYIGNFYPGNLILTGPNLPHNWISQTDAGETFDERDKVVTFTDELIQSARPVFPEITTLDALLARSRFGIEFQGPAIIRQASALMQEMSHTEGLRRLSAFLSLMSLLADTDQYALLSSDQYQRISGEKNQQRVNLAVNYIFEHYHRDLSLEEVAEHLAMQPTYFSKFFRQATGRRFVEFVNSLRITRACDLLAHSDLPITEICFDVGFTNISNFNRRFQALKGMTPSDYRKLAPVVNENDSALNTLSRGGARLPGTASG
jgi:AraC-like DNA-binding protein